MDPTTATGDPLILLLSNTTDAHVDPVAESLARAGVDYARIDTDRLLVDCDLEFTVNDSTVAATIRLGDLVIPGDQVAAIWNRRPDRPIVSAALAGDARAFAEEETAVALHGVMRALPFARWMSHPDSVRAASFKPVQLMKARQLGFRVPLTYIGRSPSAVRKFVSGLGGTAIAKLVSPGPPQVPSADPYNVFANVVTPEDLQSDDQVAASPAIYQECLRKAYEIRVTVIGTDVLACRIDSQSSGRASTDWRRANPLDIDHTPLVLGEALASRCVCLTRHFGLTFAAIDLVVTTDDQIVFLEINPNGQWLWVEELAGLPIAASIARWLAAASSPS